MEQSLQVYFMSITAVLDARAYGTRCVNSMPVLIANVSYAPFKFNSCTKINYICLFNFQFLKCHNTNFDNPFKSAN